MPADQYVSLNERLFNAVERRLFRYTAVLLCTVAMGALVGVIFWAFGRLLNTFYNLLLPLALAGVLALVLHPLVEFLRLRLHLPRLLSIVVLLLLFFATMGGLLVLLVPIVVGQAVQLMTELPDTLASWEAYFAFHFPEVSAMVSSNLERSASREQGSSPASGLGGTGTTIMSYLGLLAGMTFVPLYLFFSLQSGGLLRAQASELLSVFQSPTRLKTLYFIDVFLEYVTAFFQGQLMIAVIMGALYAVSFSAIGLEFGVLVGLVLGVLNIVPFLGTLIGLLVVLPMAYFQPEAGIQLLLLTALVFAAVQLIESWLLTPRIMANRSGLHPALVIISLFFWGTVLNGVIGMVLAVPLTAFLVTIWTEIKASVRHTLSHPESAP